MPTVEAVRLAKATALGIPSEPAKQYPLALKIFHIFYSHLPHIFVILPIKLVWQHFITRMIPKSIGRPLFSDFVVNYTRFYLGRCNLPQTRALFNRRASYAQITSSPIYSGYKDWVSPSTLVNGVQGRWLAPPGTKRSDDEVVMLFIHGGGFVVDTGGSSQIFWLQLLKELNGLRKIQFSIFLVDYELAPESPYPSQLIESLAAYHHLVNDLGIAEEKICLAGDSAGGNLVAALMLHLARPNPAIVVPSSLGLTPQRPGSVCMISPFISLVSDNSSRRHNGKFDYIDTGFVNSAALHYLGQPTADAYLRSRRQISIPSYNPLHILPISPYPPTLEIQLSKEPYVADGKGLELFSSPFVSPGLYKDLDWWKEALPEGRTMVIYGGKEILHDDIVEFVETLEKAGVAPTKLVKTYGAHDWILLDELVPGVKITKSLGPDAKSDFGLKNLAAFLQGNDLIIREKYWAEKRAAKVE